MVTKRDLEVAIAAYGLGRVLPEGSTRAAARAAVGALVKGGKVIAPPASRVATGAVRTGAAFARRNPVAAAALGGYGLYRAGALDPVEEAIQMEVDRRIEQVQRDAANPIFGTVEDVITRGVPKVAKRKVSKYSRAIKMGMSAVKASKFNGAKGKISNAKTTFAKVNKVASAVKKGKKVSAKGVTGVIKRAVSKYL